MQVPVADGGGVEFGFLLHDVGKVAIPDAILYKPDKLTEEERALMAQHPVIGAEIVREIAFLTDAVAIVRSHHERWDGTGYPDRLRGEEIPLAARVFTVADVLDALTTDRPYRPASPMAEAREMIRAERGRQFDPRVVDAFMSITDDDSARSRGGSLEPWRALVDDDPFIRKLIATTLEDVSEFDLHEASDGVEAV